MPSIKPDDFGGLQKLNHINQLVLDTVAEGILGKNNHGGSIKIKIKLNHGTTFTITLPIDNQPDTD